jgi:ParB family transcriptional regulator, chromosome partitioning protein
VSNQQRKQTGLGRGFGSLIPEDFNTALLANEAERIEQIALRNLQPHANQPRTVFDDSALQELAESIRQYGILQPLVVVRTSDDKFKIIAGERRWRAAKLAKLAQVPVIVRTHSGHEQLAVSLIENIQRVDLSPLETAVSIEHLHTQHNVSYAQIAKKLGKAEATVSNIVRLLGLPTQAREALANKKITEGHARQILALSSNSAQQQKLLTMILTHGWTVRQAEQYVVAVKKDKANGNDAHKRTSNETPETKRLAKRFNTPVQIKRTAKGGTIMLRFTSDGELARLLKELGS